nr:translation initiation factor IF-2-like [Taeniopygia guttata]
MRPRLRGLRWPRLGDVLGDTDAIAPWGGMLAAPRPRGPFPLSVACSGRRWVPEQDTRWGQQGQSPGWGLRAVPGHRPGAGTVPSRPAGAAGGSRSPAEPPSGAPVPRPEEPPVSRPEEPPVPRPEEPPVPRPEEPPVPRPEEPPQITPKPSGRCPGQRLRCNLPAPFSGKAAVPGAGSPPRGCEGPCRTPRSRVGRRERPVPGPLSVPSGAPAPQGLNRGTAPSFSARPPLIDTRAPAGPALANGEAAPRAPRGDGRSHWLAAGALARTGQAPRGAGARGRSLIALRRAAGAGRGGARPGSAALGWTRLGPARLASPPLYRARLGPARPAPPQGRAPWGRGRVWDPQRGESRPVPSRLVPSRPAGAARLGSARCPPVGVRPRLGPGRRRGRSRPAAVPAAGGGGGAIVCAARGAGAGRVRGARGEPRGSRCPRERAPRAGPGLRRAPGSAGR